MRVIKVGPGQLELEGTMISAVRFYKANGATFSGWIIKDDRDGTFSDPVETEVETRHFMLTCYGEGI